MFPIWKHAGEHMEFISPENPLFPEFKEALQQVGEVVINGQKHLDAEQRKAEAAAGQETDNGSTPGVTRQAIEAQALLSQLEVQKKQQDLAFDQAEHKQKLAFKDAEFAQNIRQKAMEQSMQKKPQ